MIGISSGLVINPKTLHIFVINSTKIGGEKKPQNLPYLRNITDDFRGEYLESNLMYNRRFWKILSKLAIVVLLWEWNW
jgi:hypothetical protein